MSRCVILVGLALVGGWAAACGQSTTPLAETRESPAAVAQAVIDAMAEANLSALNALALSEQEFREHVWPELPAARPERNLPFSYVWGDLRQKSDTSLRLMVERHRGKRPVLVDVRFESRTPYQTYTVHRNSTFVVRDEDGNGQELRLCGSMIEKDGRWKVFSYVIGD